MKTTITTLLLLFSLHLGISQDVRYEIRGKYTRGVSKEKLSTAKTMIDIRPGYPSGMIEKYTSTEISVSVDGNVMQATGANETLSASQQSLLQVAEVGSDISVEIGYIHQNPVTLFPDIRQMHFVLTVVPEVEAVYPGGYNELISYIEKNAIEKISEKFAKDQNMALISFTVDEEGEISNARITQPSNDPETDKILLKAITKMPRWKPAEDALGKKVQQEFEFSVGNRNC